MRRPGPALKALNLLGFVVFFVILAGLLWVIIQSLLIVAGIVAAGASLLFARNHMRARKGPRRQIL